MGNCVAMKKMGAWFVETNHERNMRTEKKLHAGKNKKQSRIKYRKTLIACIVVLAYLLASTYFTIPKPTREEAENLVATMPIRLTQVGIFGTT